MKIYQFISEYCQDLVDAHNMQKSLIDLSEFPHDDVITDSENKLIPVVYIDNTPVPISDFLSMDRDTFVKSYNMPTAGEMYDNYISAIDILEGSDALNHIRNAILAEKERLENVDSSILFPDL